MVHKILKIITIFLFLLFPLHSVLSAEPLIVVINEIAWMGTINSYNDEWIELYNPTGSVVNLEGWVLKAKDGTPEINLSGIISANGFYLLERTDDNTVPNVVANQIYTGALKNEGEHLELDDNLGDLVDLVDCSQGWFAGDNQTKQTMERTSQNNWQTSQNPGGTPGAENSLIFQEATPEPAPLPEPKTEPEIKPLAEPEHGPEIESEPRVEIISQEKIESETYPSGIVINEILPSPEGPDKTEEWIELKNLNNEEVDISGWKVQDTIGVTKTYIFPEKTKISANGFLVLESPISKITLNNSGEGLKLFQPNDNLIDEVVMGKALLGQSYNRFESIWVWSDKLTPGEENVISEITEKGSESVPTTTNAVEKEEKPLTIGLKKEGKAAISEAFSKKPSLHFLIALILAIFSAIIILIVKKKLKNIVKV